MLLWYLDTTEPTSERLAVVLKSSNVASDLFHQRQLKAKAAIPVNSSRESRVTFPIDVNGPYHQAFLKKHLYTGLYES